MGAPMNPLGIWLLRKLYPLMIIIFKGNEA